MRTCVARPYGHPLFLEESTMDEASVSRRQSHLSPSRSPSSTTPRADADGRRGARVGADGELRPAPGAPAVVGAASGVAPATEGNGTCAAGSHTRDLRSC